MEHEPIKPKRRKLRYAAYFILALALCGFLRTLYVNSVTGTSEYAEIYVEENGRYKLVISLTERGSRFLAETPVAAIISTLDYFLLSPLYTTEVVLCATSIKSGQRGESLQIFAYGEHWVHDAFEISKNMTGNISFTGRELHVALEKHVKRKNEPDDWYVDGHFIFNGTYQTRTFDSRAYKPVSCNHVSVG